MHIEDLDIRWPAMSEEVMTSMKDWRMQQPSATFREIEAALDERLARWRARRLEDALLVSRAADWETTDSEPPICPQCGAVLPPRGRERRTLTTHYNQTLE